MKRLLHTVLGVREDDVTVLRVVDVGPLHPHRERREVEEASGRHDAALDEGHAGFTELGEHAFPVRIQHGDRAVHVRHAGRLHAVEMMEDRGLLTHQEHAERSSVDRADHFVGALEYDLKAAGLEMLPRESQDLGVIALSPW